MATTPSARPAPPEQAAKPVTIITQTRVRPDRNDDFAAWQQEINDVVARFPGFLDHQVIPPNPPEQVDWAIVQKFASVQQAQGWLHSSQRLQLVEKVQPILLGHDDIHLIEDDQAEKSPEAVSAVISMRIAPTPSHRSASRPRSRPSR